LLHNSYDAMNARSTIKSGAPNYPKAQPPKSGKRHVWMKIN
jgi:hypothetical protein